MVSSRVTEIRSTERTKIFSASLYELVEHTLSEFTRKEATRMRSLIDADECLRLSISPIHLARSQMDWLSARESIGSKQDAIILWFGEIRVGLCLGENFGNGVEAVL